MDLVACDFVFVSDRLEDKVRSMAIHGAVQAPDHQPVRVRLEQAGPT